MLRRRLESDADRCCGGDRRHSGGFLLRIMPPSWHPAPACTPRLRCKRAILLCSNDGAASIPKSGLEIKNRCSLWAVLEGFFASIPKSGLEIKNQCTQEGVTAGFTRARRVSAPQKKRAPHLCERLSAVRTRLELATPGVTGRYSNRLNYRTSPDSLDRECKDSDFFRFSNSEDIFFLK